MSKSRELFSCHQTLCCGPAGEGSFIKRFGAIFEGTNTAGQIDKDSPIDTHHGATAANAVEQSFGILCRKGTGRISKGLRSLGEERAGAGSTTSSTTQASWVSPCPSWELSTSSSKCDGMLRFGGGINGGLEIESASRKWSCLRAHHATCRDRAGEGSCL